MTRYRWRFGLRQGRRHPTKREAQDAAIREKLAIRAIEILNKGPTK